MNLGSDLIRVADDAFDAAQVAGLYRALSRLGRMPAGLLYVPSPAWQTDRRAALGAYVPEELVTFLPTYVEKVRALYGDAPLAGIEIFMSHHASDQPAAHAGLHVDSNEPDWESAKVAWGSVLHLGPDEVLEGGGTAFWPTLPVPAKIMDRCFQPNTFDTLDALTSEWRVVDRKVNRLVAFDGRLPHYAARCRARPGEPRIALIVTGWSTIPRFAATDDGFSKLSPDEYRAFTELPEVHLDAVRAHQHMVRTIGEGPAASLARAMEKVLSM